MKAMILAAGVGSRLDPLTRNVPKPMVPVLNQPVMEHIVRLLVQHGFNEIYSNTHYLSEQISGYFHDGKSLGAKMQFHREDELRGTAGGLKNIHDQTQFFNEGTFLVIGGDDLTNIDLSAMLKYHRAKGALATIALTTVTDPSQFGVVVLDEGGRISQFVEKPAPGTAPSNLVNTGVYLFEPQILDLIPSGKFYDFGKELFPFLLAQKEAFYGFTTQDYWRDVGNLREYRDSHQDFFNNHGLFHVNVPQVRENLWQGDGCTIHESAIIETPCIIGPNCEIGPGAIIRGGSVLGESCTVSGNAVVSDSILWARSHIENHTHLERCVVGFGCRVYSDAAIFDGTIVPSAGR